MDRVGAWIWRRHRQHFAEVTLIITTAGLCVALIPPSTAAGGLFLNLSLSETVIWSIAAVVSVAITAAVVYVPLRRHADPLRRYVRGDTSAAGAAWEALLTLPQMLGLRTFLTVVPISLVVSLPVVLSYAEVGPTGVIGLVYSYLVVVLSGVALLVSGA